MQSEILAYGPAPKYYSIQYEPPKQDTCECYLLTNVIELMIFLYILYLLIKLL